MSVTSNKTENTERRQGVRGNAPISGRLMVPSGEEYPCTVKNISPTNMALYSHAVVKADDLTIIYLNNLGRFEGKVIHTFEGGFGVRINLSTPRCERIAERLEWFASHTTPEETVAANRRVFPRQPVNSTPGAPVSTSRLTLPDGNTTECSVVDISLTGACLRTSVQPDINSRVTVGRMSGHVVRWTDDGFAIQFENADHSLKTAEELL